MTGYCWLATICSNCNASDSNEFENTIMIYIAVNDIIKGFEQRILTQKKKVRPYILFVFDEAQEFVADLTNSRGIDRECSEGVETLLRQGSMLTDRY